MALRMSQTDPTKISVQHPMHAMISPILPDFSKMMPPGAGPEPPDVSMAGDSQPDMGAFMSQPVHARTYTPLERYEDNISQRMSADLDKDANPYGSPDNHPGFFGKLLHGLSVATGGPNRRQWEENSLGGELQNIEKEKGAEGQQEAQTKHLNSQAYALEHPQPSGIETKPYTLQTDKGILQWDDKSGRWTPIELNGEDVNAPARQSAPKSLQHVAGTTTDGRETFASYHPDTGQFTDQSGNPIQGFKPSDKALKGAYGSFGPSFLAYRMLNSAYNENPALLPYIAPLISRMLSQNGASAEGLQDALAATPAGQPHNAEGQVIGLRMPEAPTGATRSRGQFAESILPSVSSAESQIRSLGDKLGPVSGRWNELYTGKVGAFGPEFSGLQTQLKNIGTAWMRLHANSESARKEFEEMLRGAQNPENLIANLHSVSEQAQDYVKQGKGRPDALGTTETREYQGHTYTKGADGAWHLQKKKQ